MALLPALSGSLESKLHSTRSNQNETKKTLCGEDRCPASDEKKDGIGESLVEKTERTGQVTVAKDLYKWLLHRNPREKTLLVNTGFFNW